MKEKDKNRLEEYGLEFGDINAIKYYELRSGDKNRNEKDKQKKQNNDC